MLKLDEDRKFEREERRRLYEESEDDSLDGFIVTGSEEEEEEERGRKSKNKESKVSPVHFPVSCPALCHHIMNTA